MPAALSILMAVCPVLAHWPAAHIVAHVQWFGFVVGGSRSWSCRVMQMHRKCAPPVVGGGNQHSNTGSGLAGRGQAPE